MIYILNGEDITDKHFRHDEISYPSNWTKMADIDELKAIGIIVLDEIYPPLGIREYYDGSYIDDMILLTRTYNVSKIDTNSNTL